MGGHEHIEHVTSEWTVGQLRTALQGLPDELPIVVWVPDQPGDPIVQEMVLVDAGYSAVNVGAEYDPADKRLRLGITVDWPSGSYTRIRRRPPLPEP